MKQRMKSEPLTIPPDLKEADDLLRQYGLWAQDRYKKRCCGSAERLYKTPDYWGNKEQQEPFIQEFIASDIGRVLQLVPFFNRKIIFTHYIPKRKPWQATRRDMGINDAQWNEGLKAGVRIFWSKWRADSSLKRTKVQLHSHHVVLQSPPIHTE